MCPSFNEMGQAIARFILNNAFLDIEYGSKLVSFERIDSDD
jgi:hypothetical protein